MNISFKYVVKYSDVFDEAPEEWEYYIKDIPKSLLLETASHLLGYFNKDSKYKNYVDFLSGFFQKDNTTIFNYIIDKIKYLNQDKFYTEISIISTLSSLTFFEYVFDKSKDFETTADFDTKSFEVNIFKLYLLINTHWADKEERGRKKLNSMPEEKWLQKEPLVVTLSNLDIYNYDLYNVIVCQIHKAGLLFDFLESSEKTKLIYRNLLKKYGILGRLEFFQYFLPLIDACVMRSEGGITISVPEDEEFDTSTNFIDNFVLVPSENDDDFTQIRKNPIYKVSEGVYRVIFPLFVIEKIFKSWYFVLNEINSTVSNSDNKISNFRSFYGQEFSENYLIDRIISDSFPRKFIKKSGYQIRQDFGPSGEPDYYVRDWDKLFLIESKDTLLTSTTKASYDISKIEEELTKKLYYSYDGSGKINRKAILQLISNIEIILIEGVKYDPSCEYSQRNKLNIFPILLLHEDAFNAMGLNYLINEWFQVELHNLSLKGLDVRRVRPLTIITLDIFIIYGCYIADKRLKLHKALDLYASKHLNDYEKTRNISTINSIVSFSYFMKKYISSLRLPLHPSSPSMKGDLLSSITGNIENKSDNSH